MTTSDCYHSFEHYIQDFAESHTHRALERDRFCQASSLLLVDSTETTLPMANIFCSVLHSSICNNFRYNSKLTILIKI